MANRNSGAVDGKVISINANKNGTNSSLHVVVVVDDSYKDKSGEWVKREYVLSFTAFGKYADVLEQMLQKQDLVSIDYRLTSKKSEETGYHQTYLNIIKLVNWTHEVQRKFGDKPATETKASAPSVAHDEADDLF